MSLVIGETQIQTIMSYHHTPTNMAKIWKTGKYQMLERIWSKWNSHVPLYNPAILGSYLWETKTYVYTETHTHTHTRVHSSFLHNIENLTCGIFTAGEWINKWWHIHTRKYLWDIKRNGLLLTWNSMNKFQKYYAMWKILGAKRLHNIWSYLHEILE